MTKDEALRMTFEALKELKAVMPIFPKDGDCLIGYKDRYNAAQYQASNAIAAAKQALEQPAQQQDIDWKDQYEKQKRRAEMWIAKYEADIGQLQKACPVKAQQQEHMIEMPSNTRYAVAVEGQALTYCDNVHDAITNAQRAVYAGPDATQRAIDDLKAGRLAEWSYGFSAVRIYPPQNTYQPESKQWVELTENTIFNMMPESIPAEHDSALLSFAHAVIKACKEKNNG